MEIENIIYIVSVCLAVINMIITFIRTGTINKEINNMVYRSPAYKDSISEEEKKTLSQEFSHLKTEYALNERTGELEEKEEKLDLQKLINSSVETALDRMLNRFMPEVVEDKDELYQSYSDDLMDYASMLERAEDYREEFGLPAGMSVSDIFARVGKEADTLKSQLENIKKGVKDNGEEKKETLEKSE
ncbi:hypothetical protein [Peromfec virus RodF8_56]|uniref:Uncharacterized protein n=1 Tax=Peromfec virus RodF8_56 TaxID=2929384 RepID=A0A976N1N2_9VIRU|nr:hypothetical protein [Peromfec virus RodF8_56]